MCKVLWNLEEMDIFIVLATEMNRNEFIREASKEHISLTGENFDTVKIQVNEETFDNIWRLEIAE